MPLYYRLKKYIAGYPKEISDFLLIYVLLALTCATVYGCFVLYHYTLGDTSPESIDGVILILLAPLFIGMLLMMLVSVFLLPAFAFKHRKALGLGKKIIVFSISALSLITLILFSQW